MAVTSIWKVEGRLARVLGYAGNPDKAEGSPDEWELQGVGAAILYAAAIFTCILTGKAPASNDNTPQ